MSHNEKLYGLIKKEKKKLSVADVFNDNSDVEDDSRGDWVKNKKKQDSDRGLKKQTIIDMNRALEQDATVYQYDEVYDSMKEKELEKVQPKQERKAKYMDALIKSADRRKKDNERRTERLAQKEREAEGDMYKDKEEYVTSAYKLKLEEMKQAEEDEKRLEIIESMNDVTKQKDMGSFYRQLYKDTIDPVTKDVKNEPPELVKNAPTSSSESSSSANTSSAEDDEKKVTQEKRTQTTLDSHGSVSKTEENNPKICPERKESDGKNTDSLALSKPTNEVEPAKFSTSRRMDRSYRQRASPTEERLNDKSNERRRSRSREVKRRDNRSRTAKEDRDRDGRSRLIDKHGTDRDRGKRRSNSRSKENRSSYKRSYSPKRSASGQEAKRYRDSASDAANRKIPQEDISQLDNPMKVRNAPEAVEKHVEIESDSKVGKSKTKVNIWEKRTIGSRYDEALQRYFLRKA